jgi:hypothetical protein
MMKQAVVVALLAAFVFIIVTPHINQTPFHYTSELSKHGRVLFFSQKLEAGSKCVHISVYLKNPTRNYFALCVVHSGQKLPAYTLPHHTVCLM